MSRPLACLALVAAGCVLAEDPVQEVNPSRITDQSGAVFAWDCSAHSGCDVRRIAGSAPLPKCGRGETPWFGYSWSRFLSIDGGCLDDPQGGSWGFASGWGRKLVCDDDRDCPQLIFYEEPYEFECRAGLCQSTDYVKHPPFLLPVRDDMADLCLGAAPREQGARFDRDMQAAFDLACPVLWAPCESVPPGCPDPRG